MCIIVYIKKTGKIVHYTVSEKIILENFIDIEILN